MLKFVLMFFVSLFPLVAMAGDISLPALTVSHASNGSETYSLTLESLVLMVGITLIPSIILAMTSFIRIMIVLAILRQALGTMQSPSNQILVGIALFMTLFIMYPVFMDSYTHGIKPYLDGSMNMTQAIPSAFEPFKNFMLSQTRESDLALFLNMAKSPDLETPADTPFHILIPAFITSELKTAFQIGFMIFVPFVIIDLVVASVLMSMGMMMLSPMMISLPFKIMLFVLVDGWVLILQTLSNSFTVNF